MSNFIKKFRDNNGNEFPLDFNSLRNFPALQAGQVLKVTAVDADGQPTGWEAADVTADLAGLGIDATADEINALDGITGNVQEQIDGKAATGHTHTAADVGAAAADHTHTPASIGAAAADHTHTAADVGAAAATHAHSAGDITSGTLPIARGGTGLTASPSMLTNLGTTTAANVMAASPRPGVTGTLPVANGGTGLSTLTSGAFLKGNGTGVVTLRTPAQVLSDIGAAASSHTHTEYAASSHNHAASAITSGTLGVARGGTGVTSNPSMLINLASASAASVFAASPRPGVTGVLPVANGGTGQTSLANLAAALGTDMVEIVTLGGNGKHGSSNYRYLLFGKAPRVVIWLGAVNSSGVWVNSSAVGSTVFPDLLTTSYVQGMGFCNASTASTVYAKRSSAGTMIYWYSTDSSSVQLNESGWTYYFIGIL